MVKYGRLCPRRVPVSGSTFNFLFGRAHASVILVVTNQPGKANEVPTHKEVLATLRFKKHKTCGDQLPLQIPCTVSGTVGLMSAGVNAQGDRSTYSTSMSVLVFGLYHF